MSFVGFVLFAAMIKGLPIDSARLSSADEYVLCSLVLFGTVAQLLRGQRLVVERAVSGTIHNLARGDISSIDLYHHWFQYRDRKIQLHLKDERAIRLFFSEEVLADLTTWLNQSQ
jgi:hypothetical protein